MAANKFATTLHRNTHKITLILIYAVLEWILIVLLLLNSLFSYLTSKYAEFFGLKAPCVWCSRLDHIFDPAEGNKNMHRDLLCEAHAKEISRLGYCLNHQKLAVSQDMCENCLPKNCALFPWTKEFGVIQNHNEMACENGEVSLSCSCCGVRLDNTIYSSYILHKTSSWDVLECAQKENLITEAGDFAADLCDYENVLEDKNESRLLPELHDNVEVTEKERKENSSISAFVSEMKELEKKMEPVEEKATLIMKDKSVQACIEQEAPLEIPPQHLEFFLDYSGHTLVPVELIDSRTEEHWSTDNVKDQGCCKDCETQVEEKEDLFLKNRSRLDKVDVVLDVDINEEPKCVMLESMEMEEDENSLIFHAKDSHFPVSQRPSEDVDDVQGMAVAAREMHLDIHTACEVLAQMENNENEADVSIATDIPDLAIMGEVQNQDSSTSSANLYEPDDHGPMQVEEQMELNDIEEDKVPGTPTSVDSLNQLHKNLLFLEKRDSGAEESLDGSATSELEGSNGAVTIEQLKSALRAERKTLWALYAELEEERSASAVAANQTMAMINRLQEEKAAIQMEAMQYQRMMEEQYEYDQEALQLLNELMVKREKEKKELERELGVCKKKILDYETKEKMMVLKNRNGSVRSQFSSDSCSDAEESDGLRIDQNQEAKEEEGFYSHEEYRNQNAPVEAVINLEESFADFEEERISILVQLKVLEEKLLTMDDDNEQQLEEVKAMKEMNGKHYQQRIIPSQNGKSLLPLFGATSDENGNGFDSNGVHNYYVPKQEMKKKKLGIEEEVDHLYARFLAFEADREFIKHCESSLKKGDKGMLLLQEILQHIRDLHNVKLHARSLCDTVVI